MEEDFQRNFLRLQVRIGWVQDQLAGVPAQTELIDELIRFFKPELLCHRLNCLLNELSQGNLRPVTAAEAVTDCKSVNSGATVFRPASNWISAVCSVMPLTVPSPYCGWRTCRPR